MKSVLITGGGAGIGRAIARRFLEAGDRVLVCDIDEAALTEAHALLPGLAGTRCDVTDTADIDRLFGVVADLLGGIDVLVNNVGIGGPTLPADQLPSAEWRRVLDVNLTGTFEVTSRAIPLLRASAGTIINLSSAAGRFGYPNRIAYSVTKWGLIGFTKTLSIELGGDGISVNAILPGAVGGDRFDRVIQGRADIAGRSFEETVDDLLASQSVKRIVDPSDVAELAYFLTTKSGRAISGQMLPIDYDLQRA
jgi:NAD(P)-dependent dehydrogenase (short-subunit alcohol dehydrogenase family)